MLIKPYNYFLKRDNFSCTSVFCTPDQVKKWKKPLSYESAPHTVKYCSPLAPKPPHVLPNPSSWLPNPSSCMRGNTATDLGVLLLDIMEGGALMFRAPWIPRTHTIYSTKRFTKIEASYDLWCREASVSPYDFLLRKCCGAEAAWR